MLRLTLLFFLARLTIAGYVLQDSYTPDTFFDKFDFFTGPDPTSGFVEYVDQSTAQGSGLINTSSGSVIFGVDSQTENPANGRMSVRLTSKASYNSGLIIVDLAHMPGGECGSWPAFWTVGPDWPDNGEIDIIEGVNSNKANQMTLHTGAGCSIANANAGASRFSGSVLTSNCDANAQDQSTNAGCGISSSNDTTYGAGFNQAGGGVYATEWTASSISVYHFERSNVPSDITAGSPDPSGWGVPLATFSGGCDFTSSIKNQSIVFDTTFCGQWAGQQAVWEADSTCSALASTCQEYVASNPSAFANTYWEVNSLKVFSANGEAVVPSVPSVPSVASSAIPAAASSSAAVIPSAPYSVASPVFSSTELAAIPSEASKETPDQPRPYATTNPSGNRRASTLVTATSAPNMGGGFSIADSASDTPEATTTAALRQELRSTSTITSFIAETTTLTVGNDGVLQLSSADMQESLTLAALQPEESQTMGALERCEGSRSGCIGEESKTEVRARAERLQRSSKRRLAGRGRWVVDKAGDGLVS